MVRVVGCAEKNELCILWGIAEVIAVAVGNLETLPLRERDLSSLPFVAGVKDGVS